MNNYTLKDSLKSIFCHYEKELTEEIFGEFKEAILMYIMSVKPKVQIFRIVDALKETGQVRFFSDLEQEILKPLSELFPLFPSSQLDVSSLNEQDYLIFENPSYSDKNLPCTLIHVDQYNKDAKYRHLEDVDWDDLKVEIAPQ